MSEDVDYCPAVSIYDEGVSATHPSHRPCPDIVALENYDPEKTERARFLLSKLREKHGIKKRVQKKRKPMDFVCTPQGCVDANGTINNAQILEGMA